jgi:ribosome recycling factor
MTDQGGAADMNEKPRMEKAVQHFAEQLRGIRSGTISIGLIETVRVAVQGNLVPINRLGTARMQGDRILIAPFDRANVPAMVEALTESKLSAYAVNPTTVSVSVPPMSVEQRQDIARHVKNLGEEAKVAVRTIRQQTRKQIESSGRGSLKRVQEATDAAVAEIDRLVQAKLDELA